MREPIKSQLPILSYAPNHLILSDALNALVEVVNALRMHRYGSQFRIRASHPFWKIVFLLMG